MKRKAANSRLGQLLEALARINPGQGQQIPWEQFFQLVGSRRFVARLTVDLGEPSVLRRIVLDDLPNVTRVGRSVSRYPGLAFVDTAVFGRLVAGWLRDRQGRAAGIRFEVPEPQQSGTCERHASHSTYAGLGVRWPLLRFGLPPQGGQPQRPDVELIIQAGLPTFPTYLSALAHYLYPGETIDVSRQALPDGLVVARIADTRCWIDHMHFAPTHVKLTLRGSEVSGTTVELVGPRRQVRTAGVSGRVQLPLPGGFDDSQVLLTRGSGWLDHRYLGRTLQYQRRGDTSFEPPDWSTQLALLSTQGESEVVEYKQQLPRTGEERAKLARTIIAFANTSGGYLIYGVAEEGSGETRVVGVEVKSGTRDALTNIVHDMVVPFPAGLQIVQADVEMKPVVAVVVPPQQKPFFAMKGDPPRFFIRRQGSTYSANRDDIRELARDLADQQPFGPAWRRR